MARWLCEGIASTEGFSVDVFNLATGASDSNSRRLLKPSTLLRRSILGPRNGPVSQWGANLVEIEAMRYRARRELSRALRSYDLIQVVSGSPALARAVVGLGIPVVIQCATTAAWERGAAKRSGHFLSALWRGLMTRIVGRTERLAIRRCDAVVVENEQMANLCLAIGQRAVYKIPPGVDTTRFTPAPRWNSQGAILSVCRLGDSRKGLARLVR